MNFTAVKYCDSDSCSAHVSESKTVWRRHWCAAALLVGFKGSAPGFDSDRNLKTVNCFTNFLRSCHVPRKE